MPSLLVSPGDMNNYDYDRGGHALRTNGINSGFEYNRDEFGREDMRREEDYRRGMRNGGPPFDRFNTDYLEQTSLSEIRSNEPKFELDHLATFAAGSRSGVIHAEDGLRKLRQMENTTGIWTMRCVLIVERSCIVILDNSTGEKLEEFPIQLVTDPTAIFKNDRREIYNNLILFTIVEDPKRRGASADMHIFQSCRAPAQEIVDEILASRNGQQRVYPPGGGSKIPPPPVGPAPEPPYDFQGMRDYIGDGRQQQYNQFNQTSYSQGGQFGGPLGQRASLITRVGALREKEDYTGGSTEILERDVQLLNHCFDDIEKFVARLQQAAESFKELEKRKRDRGAKNKKRQSGDGMLNARARPPPDRDFVDIFQKFKLSFNLLAKLKAHIHDPNAPELVHFLFTPLSLIYEASRDPFHGHQNLGDQAVAPVITTDAKQLLNNCLTTKEVELWQALGKNWTTSRDEWKGPIPPYVPEFYDGWQPAANIIDEGRPVLPQPIPEPVMSRPPAHAENPYSRGQLARPIPFPDEDRPLYRPNIDEPIIDRFESNSQLSFQHHPRGGMGGFEPLPSSSRGFEPVHEADIGPSFARGFEPPPSSRFEPANPRMGSPYSAEFAEQVDRNGLSRHSALDSMPPTHSPQTMDENAAYYDELRRMGNATIYLAAHDRVGKNSKELTVKKGDYLHVLDSSKNWWKLRNYKGEIGFAPYTILKPVKTDIDPPDHHSLTNGGGGVPLSYRSGISNQPDTNVIEDNFPRRSSSRRESTTSDHGTSSVDLITIPTSEIQNMWRRGSEPPKPLAHPPIPYQAAARGRARSIHITNLSQLALESEALASPQKHDTKLNLPRVSLAHDLNERNPTHPRDPGNPRPLSGGGPDTYSNDLSVGMSSALNARPPSHELPLMNELRGKVSSRSPRHEEGISDRSSTAEVTDWLTHKHFGERVVEIFDGYTGLDMFNLRPGDLQHLLSHEDATRLDGLLGLQKTSCGYNTQSELNDIFQKRKQHVMDAELQQEQSAPLRRPHHIMGQIVPNDFRRSSGNEPLLHQLIRQKSQLRQSQADLSDDEPQVLY